MSDADSWRTHRLCRCECATGRAGQRDVDAEILLLQQVLIGGMVFTN